MAPDNVDEKEYRDFKILSGAIENTNEAFVTINQKHQVVFFNKAAEKMFGYSRKEVLGNDIAMIMSSDCMEGHRAAVKRYLDTKKPRLIGHETEFVAGRKNGSTFPANISFSVTKVEGNIYFTAIIRDLSETKELEDKASRAERLAVLGQFVAEISHEIKNPLMTIGGFSRQLKRSINDRKNSRKLEIITEEVARLENLLFEMREYYKPRGISIEKVDLIQLLNETLDMFHDESEKRNIALEFKAVSEPLIAYGNKHKLKQVFINIAKNSFEAMKKDGKFTINAENHGNVTEITFTDNGPGMNKQVLDKVFTPFFTTKKRGSGLGLPLSKRIIEEHPCGAFEMKSKEGKGAVITITLAPQRPENIINCDENAADNEV